jgi:CheY-like chemotaxis protein
MTVRSDLGILLVEDCPEDCEATIRALKRSGLENPVVHCVDGDEALDYLHRRGAYAQPRAPRPAMVLLDLNLPGTDGRQVLSEIKSDASLRSIPVLIFTTSNHEEDIKACYQAGANSYIRKPVDLDGFSRALRGVAQYWFDLVQLPPNE